MDNERWTQIIRAKTSWFDIRFDQLWHYRDLIFLFVKRDFTAVYKQTILGPLWHLIQPLVSSFIFSFAFAFVAKLSTEGTPPILFYLSGLVPWTYFADCTNRTSGTFTANAGIFGKVYFPRLVIPLSVVLSNLVKFFIQFFLFISIYIYYFINGDSSFGFTSHLLLLPVLIGIMAVLGLGIGLIVSALTIRYRDLANLIGFGIQLLMYLSPVVFPISIWPEKFHWLIYANPMTSVIETFRYGFLGIGVFDGLHLIYSISIAVGILFFGILIFNKVEKNFIDTI